MTRGLTRRNALALIGMSGAVMFGASPASSCVVRPQQAEGPFFVDDRLNRSDIRSDPATGALKAGVPLDLAIRAFRISGTGCTPLAGAYVDLWHCDASGVYSGVRDAASNSIGQKFLRGYQVTDTAGTARFTTIYPGWYQGRTVHLHFKIRTDPASRRRYEFTSQLYFDDALTDRVHAQAPYTSRGQRTVRNGRDGLFGSEGRELMLTLTQNGPGYGGTFDVGLEIG